MNKQLQFVALCFALWPTGPVVGATPLIELAGRNESWQGKLLARDQTICWLLDPAGQIHEIPLNSVRSYRRVSDSFRSYPAAQMRARLAQEFGSDFEVAGTRHYLVCATRGGAQKYADLLEDVYRTVYLYFRTRGFAFDEPEFPLVALVFPDRSAFERYCRQDKVAPSSGLAGYYLRTSNRIALFDTGAIINTGHTNINAGVRDTLIHEAIHQFAFNIGLHSRVGDNPKWVVEGLATVLEAPGARENAASRSAASRINRDRFQWFRQRIASHWTASSLAAWMDSDALFESAALDAYSQAWALSFYLIETRPREYVQYLKKVASRDPLRPYEAEQRLHDFRAVFGDNLDFLEAEFLRFFERLN